MAENNVNLLKLSENELDNAIFSMPTEQFIKEGKATLELLLKTHKVVTSNDKQIMDVCKKMLESGQLETAEERRYFMDNMIQASKNIDKKTWGVIAGGTAGVVAGLITAAIIKALVNKH